MVMSPAKFGPENDWLARASRNCKQQIHPVIRKGATHQQTRKCLKVIKILSWGPRWVLDTKIDWPTARRS
jgi:hypothetical protein